jgi:hypothetical protein
LLDALDECGTDESRRPLLDAFANVLPELPENIKVLVTSRSLGPEADIDHLLAEQLWSMTSHLELDSMANREMC